MDSPSPVDEGRHAPGPEPLWSEAWCFSFVETGGSVGGWVDLELFPARRVAWYTAFVVGPERPCVAVVDLEVPVPRGRSLEIRSEGLWADHTCETPLEHWSVAAEAFAVAVDDPAELYGRMRGDRTPFGLDLEWEDDATPTSHDLADGYEVACLVHGEVLLADERIALEGHGHRAHRWGVLDRWATAWCWAAGRLDGGIAFCGTDVRSDHELGPHGFPAAGRISVAGLDLTVEPLSFAPVALPAADGRVVRVPRALSRYTTPDGRSGHGWTEWNQPTGPAL